MNPLSYIKNFIYTNDKINDRINDKINDKINRQEREMP